MVYILEASEVIDKIIHLFGRDTETNIVSHFEIKDFNQYLFVKCRRDLQDCVSCYNEPVRKVIYKTPSEHAALIRRHRSTYDGDLRRDVQYLIERNIRYAFDEEMNPVDAGITPPRVCYYDIEVHSSDDEFPTPEAAAHPIVAISSKDSHTGAERIFTLKGDYKVCREHTRLPTEKALIEEWARWVAKYDFDILTGWYNLGFDWLYILNRAKKLKADISQLSRIPSVYPDEKSICGRTHVDMLEMFKVWAQSGGQLDSYDLKSISANPKFGDFAYADYGASIGTLIEAGDWHTLVQYSLNDVKALSKIDAKCNLINFFEGLRRQTGIKFHQYSQKTRIIESLLYYEFHIPLPSRRVHERVAFEGAYVLRPTPGIKENVGAFDLACVDGDTDVLTNSGWKNIKEVATTDLVASLNTETENMEFKPISHYHKYFYEGEMYKCDKHNVKFLITPNHRVLFNKHDDRSETYYKKEYEYMEVHELLKKYSSHPLKLPSSAFNNWCGEHYETIRIGERIIDGNDFFRFVGLWLADGTITRKLVSISQSKLHTVDIVRDIVKCVFPEYKEYCYAKKDGRLDEHIFQVHRVEVAKWFIEHFGLCRSKTKFIPRWMLNASKENLTAMWDGLLLGDGFIDIHGAQSYASMSKRLADDVQELLLKIGKHANLRTSVVNGAHKVCANNNHTSNVLRGFYITKEAYSDYVYCLTTEHGNFIMRKDGVTHVTGNSLYPSIIVGKNISPDAFNMIPRAIVKLMEERERLRAIRLETGDSTIATAEQAIKAINNSFYGAMGYPGFKLFDAEKVALIPMTGQDIIKGVHKYCNEFDVNVDYGDSVSGDMPVCVRCGDENFKEVCIDSLFTSVDYSKPNGKEYCSLHDVWTETLDEHRKVVIRQVPYIMRHKCDKKMFRIWLNDIWWINVTEDHSLLAYENGVIFEATPSVVKENNYMLISNIVGDGEITLVEPVLVEEIPFDDYVYDLSIDDPNHRYWVNGILVKNTDSSYCSPITNIDDGLELQNNINKYLREWASENNVPITLAPKIKLEKLYKKMIFKSKIGSDEGAKKSYAGYYIWKDGKFEEGIDYVGIDVKRSDRAPITKSVMRDFFEKILKEDDVAGAIENVRVNYRAVMSGDVDVFDIGIPQGVKDIEANRPHARGSKNFESVFGRPLRKQQKPRLLMCKRPVKELCVDDSVTRSDLDKAYIEVDWSDMADRTIARKMKPLFDAIAKDWDKEIEMQRSLWEFM